MDLMSFTMLPQTGFHQLRHFLKFRLGGLDEILRSRFGPYGAGIGAT